MTTTLRLLLVWAALMVLLALTVAVTFVPIGNWRMAISYAIAIAKAALVLWFFMELRADGWLALLACLAAFVCIAILFLLLAADYATRHWAGGS